MLINKNTGKSQISQTVSTSNILLVPYEDHHVPTYHSWMQNEEIQEATASEPLSLPEEYAMQRSWRSDPDKLTFIICLPVEAPTSKSKFPAVVAQRDDVANRMLGDINLFLTPADEDPEGCIGELELMIAPINARRQGYGRAALLAFLMYMQKHLDEILDEYWLSVAQEEKMQGDDRKEKTNMRLLQLRVKIGSKNEKSINLFSSVGFIKVEEGENYFGEIELIFEGFLGEGRIEGLFEKWGYTAYEEQKYTRPEL